ncbi:hypothetical protein PM082_016791 [Marasmius tenuissimus]|nr:hypothetical protein PM082_016791 [Marasmius tenuissimus]
MTTAIHSTATTNAVPTTTAVSKPATTTKTFHADAVLFDMDGTLTDSISAVEAAWGRVAQQLNMDKDYVIAATHGKRAIDNLRQLKPHLQELHNDDMDPHVQEFEESILFFADAYNSHGPGSRRNSFVSTPSRSDSFSSSSDSTPPLTPGSSAPSSRSSSIVASQTRRPSFGTRLGSMLRMTMAEVPEARVVEPHEFAMEDESAIVEDDVQIGGKGKEMFHDITYPSTFHPWQIDACAVDRSVKILPGVKKMIDSIPVGRYAVATSGAKTYAHGCMTRVGITPPSVTITADDKRLKAGKPAPDPFLLAADCLGFDAKRCVVFEDSPSGIRAGVASGATVIAVCTSHPREKVEGNGAHFVVEDMSRVRCIYEEKDGQGRLRFEVDVDEE